MQALAQTHLHAGLGALCRHDGIEERVKRHLPRVRGGDGPIERESTLLKVNLAIVVGCALHVESNCHVRGRLDKVMAKTSHGFGRRGRHSRGGSNRGHDSRGHRRRHLARHLLIDFSVALADPGLELSIFFVEFAALFKGSFGRRVLLHVEASHALPEVGLGVAGIQLDRLVGIRDCGGEVVLFEVYLGAGDIQVGTRRRSSNSVELRASSESKTPVARSTSTTRATSPP